MTAISEICKKYNVWMHVDGAIGGFYRLTERGNKLLNGAELCDSMVVDPHKSLFLPYGTGALIVKNIDYLKDSNCHDGPYMHNYSHIPEEMPPDIMNLGFELSRTFRGFSVWLPLQLIGFNKISRELDNKIDLTLYCYDTLKNDNEIGNLLTFKHKPSLTILAFQIDINKLSNKYDEFKYGIKNNIFDGSSLDEMNKMFLSNVNKRGRVLISSFNSVNNRQGDFFLRLTVSSYRTQKKHCDYAIEDIKQACQETIHHYLNKIKNDCQTNEKVY